MDIQRTEYLRVLPSEMNVNHIKLEEQDTGLCRNFKAMVGLMPSLEEEPMKKTEEKEEEDEEDDAFSFASLVI